jgi:hypothetical protein
MNCLAKMLLWVTFISLAAAVVWYSYELFNHGYVVILLSSVYIRNHAYTGKLTYACTLLCRTDPHLIAWFSAGAFVLMGFPISVWGIVGHVRKNLSHHPPS